MSWLNKINNVPIEIITGDGKVYNPIFRTTTSSIPMNETVYEFVNKEGGLVVRGLIGVESFPVELHFTGSNVLDTIDEFKESTKDTRPWTFQNPFIGTRTVQPTTIGFSYSALNDVIVTTTLYETISDLQPVSVLDVQSDILESIENVSEIAIETATQTNTSITNNILDKYKLSAVTEEDLENVIQKGNETLNTVSDATEFMRQNVDFLRAPALYYASAKNRIANCIEALEELGNAIISLPFYYISSGAVMITALCEAAITKSNDIAIEQDLPELGDDYTTRNDVISTINTISTYSRLYFDNIGTIQNNGYLPNYQLIRALLTTISKTLGQLLIFAQDALQERTYVLPENLPLIVLVHRLYGNLDNIESFTKFNNLQISELLIIPKDKEVVYFV